MTIKETKSLSLNSLFILLWTSLIKICKYLFPDISGVGFYYHYYKNIYLIIIYNKYLDNENSNLHEKYNEYMNFFKREWEPYIKYCFLN